MDKKKKIGIAGYGIIGRRRHDVINQNKYLEVVSACDKEFIDISTKKDDFTHYQDYQSMIDNQDLDAVFVCMSNDIAAEVTIACLKQGIDVFCEKPPGINVEQVRDIIAAEAVNPGTKLMYGFNHRYHDAVIEALRICKSNELGKIINLRGVYGKARLITFNQTDWRTKRELAGGGVLLDQGIHMVDLMRLFGGEFTEVKSFISNSYWGYDVEDNAYAIMRTQDGVVGMIHSSATQWEHKFNLDITLEKGSLNLGGILTSTKSYGDETLTVTWAEEDDVQGSPNKQTNKFNSDLSWKREVDLFADILNDTICDNGYAGSEDALKTMSLVFDIYYSDKEWREYYNIKNPRG